MVLQGWGEWMRRAWNDSVRLPSLSSIEGLFDKIEIWAGSFICVVHR